MELSGKGLIGAAALLLSSAAAAIGVVGTNWTKNNPVAKTWLSDNHFSQREKFVDFENNSNTTWFALGCHKILFGGKNFNRLYDDGSVVTASVKGAESTSEKPSLPIFGLFQDTNEPLLGCSTAYLKSDAGSKKVYQYELALRQGDKGLDERISIHEDKIVSQLVFYEKKPQEDSSKPPEYKHLFGLYRYIQQSQTTDGNKTYKVANPNPTGQGADKWSELDLSNGSADSTSRYYSVWVDDTSGKGIFDDLGVKLNGNPFSSVIKEQNDSATGVSDFVYVASKGDGSDLSKPTGILVHYDLSVLDSLINNIKSRKGTWTSAQEFCSADIGEGERKYISEVKRLSQYCYEIKKETTTTSKDQEQ